jgi:protein tyrosine/serine phosphatase
MDDGTRHVFFEACFNFRDLGGYPTRDGCQLRWGALYRSDTLHRLTEADAQMFTALGLRTVIDLRSQTELDDHGRLAVANDLLSWHHIPMLDNVKLAVTAGADDRPAPPEPLPPGEGYFRIAEEFGRSLTAVFDLLTQGERFPAVFHCTSGKDRTGIVAALVLDVLGVPDDVIAADYVLTERARQRSGAWIKANEPAFAAFLAQVPPERRGVAPETILGFLERIRSQYGSVPQLLAARGISAAQLDVLRTRLLAC